MNRFVRNLLVLLTAVAGLVVLGTFGSTACYAQSAPPKWQTAAGGKMSFDVVSVRQSAPDLKPSGNIQLDALDAYAPTGGLFTSNASLVTYIIFAYKIIDTSEYASLNAQLPKWAQTNRFDVEARSEGNPTKDQMRLMMQSVLEDRFKLAMHTQSRQAPVYALVLDKSGKPGPQLQPHPENAQCPDIPITPAPRAPGSVPPPYCGAEMAWHENGQMHIRMIDVTMEEIADYLGAIGAGLGGLDRRPVLDQTGLRGRFDFNLLFTTAPNGSILQPDSGNQPDVSGLMFTDALEKQLGLKLVKQNGSVNEYMIDHIEMPSAN